MTLRIAITAAALVLGAAARGHADEKYDNDSEEAVEDAWTPTTMFSVGAQAGLETPGAVLLTEIGVGRRFGAAVWQLRGVGSVFAGRMGGGSSQMSARLWELRVGPNWWRCAKPGCVGLAAEGGVQRLTRRESGGDVDPGAMPDDVTQRDLTGVVDLRLRFLGVRRPLTIEANLGLRLKARMYTSGGFVHDGEKRLGGGFLLGLAAGAAF